MKTLPASVPFNRERTIKGLFLRIGILEIDLYAYVFAFTFNFIYKDHKKELEDRDMELFDDNEFFKQTEDPYVINSLFARNALIDAVRNLLRRYGAELFNDNAHIDDIREAGRFKTYTLKDKDSASYTELGLHYEKTLISYINYLYTMGCVFTASSYRIPKVLKDAFTIGSNENLKLLNTDLYIVDMLQELIINLLAILKHLREELANN